MRNFIYLAGFIFLVSCYVYILYFICRPKFQEKQENKQISSIVELESVEITGSSNSGMIEIEGDYCPAVVQECLHWADPNNHGANGKTMCTHFKSPSKCVSKTKIHLHFKIDKFEYPNIEGQLPNTLMSYNDGKEQCESLGKRLCEEKEWTFACEGEEMLPYPYGYDRDATACNIDKDWIDPFNWTDEKGIKHQGLTPLALLDKRVPSGSMPKCVSPFGVFDLSGNVDEFTYDDKGFKNHGPWISAMKGGAWLKGQRARCRPKTSAHGPEFRFYESNFRCCLSLKERGI